MRKYIIILVLMFSYGSIYSQRFLDLVRTDNSIQSFDLLTTEVRFSPTGDLLVKQGTNSDVQFSFSNVKELRFVNGTTTIASALLRENISIFQNENNLYLKGIESLEQIKVVVFNSAGQIIVSKNQLFAEPINIALLQSGIYILKLNNNHSFKFIKK
jgi:accessory colonization factor AcfC